MRRLKYTWEIIGMPPPYMECNTLVTSRPVRAAIQACDVSPGLHGIELNRALPRGM